MNKEGLPVHKYGITWLKKGLPNHGFSIEKEKNYRLQHFSFAIDIRSRPHQVIGQYVSGTRQFENLNYWGNNNVWLSAYLFRRNRKQRFFFRLPQLWTTIFNSRFWCESPHCITTFYSLTNKLKFIVFGKEQLAPCGKRQIGYTPLLNG